MKYLLIVFGILILIPAIIWLIGMSLPQSHTAEISGQFEASSEKIFTLITDVESFPNWRRNVDRVEKINEAGGDLQWREYYSNEDPLTFRIVGFEENNLLVSEITDENLPFGGTWTYNLESEGETTLLTITENGEVYNPFFRFVSAFIIGHDTTIKQYMADLETALTE